MEKSDQTLHKLLELRQENPDALEKKSFSESPASRPTAQTNEAAVSKKGFGPMTLKDPANAKSLNEQLQLIAEGLSQKISSGNVLSSVVYAHDWIDGIVDDQGALTEQAAEELSTLDNESLLKFLGGVLATCR